MYDEWADAISCSFEDVGSSCYVGFSHLGSTYMNLRPKGCDPLLFAFGRSGPGPLVMSCGTDIWKGVFGLVPLAVWWKF